jgi:hypothetical protein
VHLLAARPVEALRALNVADELVALVLDDRRVGVRRHVKHDIAGAGEVLQARLLDGGVVHVLDVHHLDLAHPESQERPNEAGHGEALLPKGVGQRVAAGAHLRLGQINDALGCDLAVVRAAPETVAAAWRCRHAVVVDKLLVALHLLLLAHAHQLPPLLDVLLEWVVAVPVDDEAGHDRTDRQTVARARESIMGG